MKLLFQSSEPSLPLKGSKYVKTERICAEAGVTKQIKYSWKKSRKKYSDGPIDD